MTDMVLMPSGDGFDIAIEDADVRLGNDLRAAVLLSLNVNARASDDWVHEKGLSHAGGWWGNDTLPSDQQYGSLLWTMSREKHTQDTLNTLRNIAEQKLNWLLVDGLASAVRVNPTVRGSTVVLIIEIQQPIEGESLKMELTNGN